MCNEEGLIVCKVVAVAEGWFEFEPPESWFGPPPSSLPALEESLVLPPGTYYEVGPPEYLGEMTIRTGMFDTPFRLPAK